MNRKSIDQTNVTTANSLTISNVHFKIASPKKASNSLLFGAIRDQRLILRKPIPVTITNDESGSVVVCWKGINEYGYGPNTIAALDDFGKTLTELYFSLKSERNRLGSDLNMCFKILRQYLRERCHQ